MFLVPKQSDLLENLKFKVNEVVGDFQTGLYLFTIGLDAHQMLMQVSEEDTKEIEFYNWFFFDVVLAP